jgi:hypothetical protein
VLGEARQWLWPLVAETRETGKDLVGLSIHALGTASKGEAEGKKGLVVESITHADSVDVVTTPAAGGGFTNLVASEDGWTQAVIEQLSLAELREARPDMVDDLKREWKTTRDTAAVKEARAEVETAQEEVRKIQEVAAKQTEENRALRAKLKEALVDRLLDAQKALPKEWKAQLRTSLIAAEESEWDGIVEAEIRKAAAVRGKVVVTGAGKVAPIEESAAPRKPSKLSRLTADLPYREWVKLNNVKTGA